MLLNAQTDFQTCGKGVIYGTLTTG